MGNKKGGFISLSLSLSLSLSFTHLTMIHKKRTCLLLAKVGTDSSNYGKIDTF
jgi:hypothetical protein